jgi:hypothetical protein
MKANLKGLGGIKGLLLLHGEKVAMGVVGLLALWFVYSSMRLPRLDDNRQAANLQSEIQLTNNAVTESKWPEDDAPEAEAVRKARSVARTGDVSVKPGAYSISGFNDPIVAPTVLRVDPVLLNAVDVHAVGGTGVFAFLDETVRNARMLAEKQKEEERARQQRRDAERLAAEGPGEGRNQRGRGEEGGIYGRPGGTMEMDPDHPNRRPVDSMARPAGAPLQGDERQERVHWAIVTAKVPIREQLKLYQDAFQNARGGYDPTRDFPRYVGYKVQRAEIIRGKPLEWKDVPVYDGQLQSVLKNDSLGSVVSSLVLNKLYERITKFWAAQLPDVVDQRYLVDVLALPLPPLVGRDWGSEATHPDIPLAINTPPLEEEIVPLPDEPVEEEGEADEFRDPDAGQTAGLGGYGERGSPMGGRGYGGYGEGGRGYGGGIGRGDAMSGRERAYGGGLGRPGGVYGMGGGERGYGGYGGEGRGGAMGAGGRAGSQPMTLPRGVDFWLLRFFDFSVEPGKKYKYHVQLVLADPNVGLLDPERVLAPAVLDRLAQATQAAKAKNRPRPTVRYVDDWSEPSRTAGIPLAGSIKLAEAKLPPAGKFNEEPSVKLLVESFDVDADNNAIQAATQRDFRRGYVANMTTKDQEYLGPGGLWIDKLESFKFFTGMTVLDMEGGETLGKDATAPARVLLMDAAGELHIRSEIDDKPAIDYHKLIFEKPKNRDGREGEMERSPYGGGGNPYGGGRRAGPGT